MERGAFAHGRVRPDPTPMALHDAVHDRETYARGLLVYADEPPKYGPQIADHP